MNRKIDTSQTLPHKRWAAARWLVPMISLPVVLSVCAVAWLGYRELRAAQQLQLLAAPLQGAADITSVASPEEAFREATSTEKSAEWSRIYFLLSTQELYPSQELPVIGNAPLPFVINPNQPWEAESPVEDYLAHMQPVLEMIHRAAAAPEPVWQPIAFNGYATLLPHMQAARDPARLLQLQAELALYQGDPQRALAAIAAMRGTARSIDWDLFMVGQLTHASLQDMALRTIQRSLHTNIWNVEQVEQLMQLIEQPIAIEETFRLVVQHELAWVRNALESDHDFFPGMRLVKFPTAKLAVLRQYTDLEKVPVASQVTAQGAGRLSTRVGDYEEDWLSLRGGAGALAGSLLPAFTSYALSVEMSEQTRQLTLVALALKRFQLEHQRWPRELAELTEVGLTPKDWTMVGVGIFGYSAEGQRAYVWGVKREEASIAPQRPVWDDEKPEEAYHLVVVSH